MSRLRYVAYGLIAVVGAMITPGMIPAVLPHFIWLHDVALANPLNDCKVQAAFAMSAAQFRDEGMSLSDFDLMILREGIAAKYGLSSSDVKVIEAAVFGGWARRLDPNDIKLRIYKQCLAQ